jgi:asparaginyl-tRNA synthetase
VDLTRNLIVNATRSVMENSSGDLDFLLEGSIDEYQRRMKQSTDSGGPTSYADTLAPSERTIQHLTSPESYQVITYDEAMSLLSKHSSALSTPVDYQEGPTREQELYLVHNIFEGKPVFVLHYPRTQKAFYMKRSQGNCGTAACMDLLVPIVGEVAGGSEREDSLEVLIQNMQEKGMGDTQEYDWYLDLRRYGSVPHAGFGLGFERYLQLITGTRNIRDVVAMPRAYQHCQL